MSFLGDALAFEQFNLKDMWDGLRKDPKRLLLGVDPWSTKAWNFVLNRDDKPLVDQMGGPYAGRTFSVGSSADLAKRDGVYKRAQEAGVNIGPASNMHNVAHAIAALYAANGLGNIGDGGFGGEGYGNMPKSMPQTQQPQQQDGIAAEIARLQQQQQAMIQQQMLQEQERARQEQQRMQEERSARERAALQAYARRMYA